MDQMHPTHSSRRAQAPIAVMRGLTILTVVVSSSIAVIYAAFAGGGTDIQIYILGGMTGICALIGLAAAYRRDPPDLFAPALLFAFMFVIFWIARTVHLVRRDVEPLAGLVTYRELHLDNGLQVSLLILTLTYLGYITARRLSCTRLAVSWIPSGPMLRSAIQRRRVRVLVAGLVIVSIVGLVGHTDGPNNLMNYIYQWSTNRFGAASGNTTTLYAVLWIQPAVWLGYALILTRPERNKRDIWPFLWFIPLLTYALFALLVVGSRVPIVMLFVGLAVLRDALKGRLYIRSVVMLIGLAIVISVAVGAVRYNLSHGNNAFAGLLASEGGEEVVSLEQFTRNFAFVDLTYYYWAHVPDEYEYIDGRSLLDIPLYIVPRTLWSEKPEAFGSEVLLKEAFPAVTRSGSHMNPTLYGDLYINWGWIGMILGSVFVGATLTVVARFRETAWTQQEARLSRPVEGVALMYAALIFGFLAIFKFGLLGGVVRLSLLYLGPIVLAGWLTRAPSRRSGWDAHRTLPASEIKNRSFGLTSG